MKILILREDWQASLACIQSFGRRGHQVYALRHGARSDHARSDYLSGLLPALPERPVEARAQALCDLVAARGFDLVVPISDADAGTVALAAALRPDCRAFVSPSPAAVEVARDRNRTAALCEALGLHMPASRRVTRDSLPEAAAELGFPCFLKLSHSAASGGVFELASSADLARAGAGLGAGVAAQLQRKVEGDFLGITGFCLQGRLLESAGFRAPYEDVRHGTPPYAWVEDSPQMVDILSRIAGHLNWTGGIDLDFIEEGDDRLALLEINPRLSGTVNIALALGRDLPAHYLAAIGAPPRPAPIAARRFDVFVSLAEEARARKRPGGVQATRRIGRLRLADNGYRDDRGYARALFLRRCGLRCEEWGMRLLRRLRLRA
ncbi:ATP-grasp domain-containing protein [Shimia sp.]|uniref:ATP-grasp domain-containing protein n=1 Tax=Shimia sp. TaxID=1954381 RepID=UPI0035652EEE